MELLGDGERHAVVELKKLPVKSAVLDVVIRDMMNEEELLLDAADIKLNTQE